MTVSETPLSGPEASLWLADPTELLHRPYIRSSMESVLDEEEMGRYRKALSQEAQDAYLVAHALLRFGLSDLDPRVPPRDWRFARDPRGKPALEDRRFLFSLSHTRGFVGCLFAREPEPSLEIGFDLENTERPCDYLAIARENFASAEIAILEQQKPAALKTLFFKYWTLKEAFLKARGYGLSRPMSRLSFSFSASVPETGEISLVPDPELVPEPRHWQLRLLAPSPSNIGAIAIHRGNGLVREQDLRLRVQKAREGFFSPISP